MFRELGFTVEKIGETRPDPVERRDWTAEEVRLIVVDDCDMLRLDPAGQEFVKAERNRALQERLNGRTRTSIAFKHQRSAPPCWTWSCRTSTAMHRFSGTCSPFGRD